VVSGHERVIKPEARIYEIALERTGLQPADLLFVDDSLANIEAAAALGFHVHHFTDPATLRPTVEKLGLL
jgi:HAD superfamily hydrolase (TIGR01509 family)